VNESPQGAEYERLTAVPTRSSVGSLLLPDEGATMIDIAHGEARGPTRSDFLKRAAVTGAAVAAAGLTGAGVPYPLAQLHPFGVDLFPSPKPCLKK
jgi:hypothetical protein